MTEKQIPSIDEIVVSSQERNYNAAQVQYDFLCKNGKYTEALQEQGKMHSIIGFMHRCGYYLDQDQLSGKFLFLPEGH